MDIFIEEICICYFCVMVYICGMVFHSKPWCLLRAIFAKLVVHNMFTVSLFCISQMTGHNAYLKKMLRQLKANGLVTVHVHIYIHKCVNVCMYFGHFSDLCSILVIWGSCFCEMAA